MLGSAEEGQKAPQMKPLPRVAKFLIALTVVVLVYPFLQERRHVRARSVPSAA